ncbi:MAG: ABC transporter permease subunit [Myxococcota bacterium]
MTTWWSRPLVRLVAALSLPLLVPAVITAVLWILPGDPADIICPPEICQGGAALAHRWGLDRGPWGFYTWWLSGAVHGEFGNSWRAQQGVPVAELIAESLPATAELVLLALIPLTAGAALAAAKLLPQRLDPLWHAIGLAPAVILGLLGAAWIELTWGAMSHDGWPGAMRLVVGAGVLAFADGAFAGAVSGTRSTFDEEVKQRYIAIAVLRGESALGNALPNVLPALAGQLRGRVLHVMSGAVVVEVVLGIPGLGELLFDGTLLQDFGVVLAASWAFSLLSAALMCAQALVEIGVAWAVRRHPPITEPATGRVGG